MPSLTEFVRAHHVSEKLISDLAQKANSLALEVYELADENGISLLKRIRCSNGSTSPAVLQAEWLSVQESIQKASAVLYNHAADILLMHAQPDADARVLFDGLSAIIARDALSLWADVMGGRPLISNISEELMFEVPGDPLAWTPDALMQSKVVFAIERFRRRYITEFLRTKKVISGPDQRLVLPGPKRKGKSGRKPGVSVNVSTFVKLRGCHSQEDFAEVCDVSLATIQRAEDGHRLDQKTLKKIVNRYNKKFNRSVDLEDLTATS